MPQMAFEYLEIRHCIFEVDGEIHSFTDDGEFETVRARLASDDAGFSIAWTIYGRHLDEAGQLLATAIGDFTERDDAFAVMNALLAPLAKARDELNDVCQGLDLDNKGSRRIFLNGVGDVRDDLTDFIAQSSDRERL